MCISQLLNGVGLSLDIAGALILWFFPLPVIWKTKEGIYAFDTSNHEAIARHVKVSRIGLGFLVAGFLFQLLGLIK